MGITFTAPSLSFLRRDPYLIPEIPIKSLPMKEYQRSSCLTCLLASIRLLLESVFFGGRFRSFDPKNLTGEKKPYRQDRKKESDGRVSGTKYHFWRSGNAVSLSLDEANRRQHLFWDGVDPPLQRCCVSCRWHYTEVYHRCFLVIEPYLPPFPTALLRAGTRETEGVLMCVHSSEVR